MEFIIGVLKRYMINNQIDIFEHITFGNLFFLVDMIQMGTNSSEEEAMEIFKDLQKTMTIVEISQLIINELFPQEHTEKKTKTENKKQMTLLEFFEDVYTQMKLIDPTLSLKDFDAMSTKYMCTYAETLGKLYIQNTNKEWANYHIQSMINAGVITGGLKEPPQLNEDGTLHKKSARERALESIKR